MVTRTELAKIKKQATLIAQAKGESIDDLTAKFLQKYVQENFEWVLESFAKQNNQKETHNVEQTGSKKPSEIQTFGGETE